MKPLNEYFFANREDPDEMLHFIRVFTVCNGKLSSDKRLQYILKITTCQWPDIYNGLTQVYLSSQKEDSITIKRVKLRLVS